MISEHYNLDSYLSISQSCLTMGVMFVVDLIRKEEIVLDLEAFVERG
jgi:hypothetical protein